MKHKNRLKIKIKSKFPSLNSMQSKKKKSLKSLLEIEMPFVRVGLTQKALFAKHLSVTLKAGIPLTEALSIAQDSAFGGLKKILGQISKSIQGGSSLSAAFRQYPKVFPILFVSAARAGEASGTLVENLENVAEQLEKEKNLLTKIKGAMLYPVVVLSAAFVLGMALSFLVLPKITPLFEGLKMDLPFTTRALIWFSHFIQNYGLYLFLAIIVFIVFIIWLARQRFFRPVAHWLLLKIPILNKIVLNANLARFSRTLAMLLKSGLNIDEALEITKDTVGNYYFEEALEKVSKNVQKGTKLSDNLSEFKGLFPKMLTRMIKVGEESGRFEETLFYLADFYEAQVDTATKSLSTIIEPLLLLIIGLVVAFLALSIITPIYNITGGIRG